MEGVVGADQDLVVALGRLCRQRDTRRRRRRQLHTALRAQLSQDLTRQQAAYEGQRAANRLSTWLPLQVSPRRSSGRRQLVTSRLIAQAGNRAFHQLGRRSQQISPSLAARSNATYRLQLL